MPMARLGVFAQSYLNLDLRLEWTGNINRAFDSSVGEECACSAGDPGLIPWRRDRLPTPVFLNFPCGPAGKESACKVEDLGSIPGLGRSPGEGKGYPLQYSGLENPIYCTAQGVTKNQTWLSYFHFKQSAAAKYITNMWKRNVCHNREGQIFK